MANRQPSRRPQLSSPPPPPPMPPEQRLQGDQQQSPPPPPSPLPPSPPPPPPMPPGQGHRGGPPQRPPPPTPPPPRQGAHPYRVRLQRQRSHLPPFPPLPPPMPPRQRLHGDQRQRPPPPPSPLPPSPPPPPPMPPGQDHRGGPPQRPPPPTPPPPRQRPQRQRSPLPPSPPPPPPMPLRRFDPQVLSYSQIVQLHLPPTRAREDQPAPGQIPTPNPGPSPGQDIHDMLDKAVADRELDESQRRQELLATTKLEELSTSNASSLPPSPPPPPPMPLRRLDPQVLSYSQIVQLDPPPTRAREDQPAPGQTPTPNPGPSPGQDIGDMLDKAVADGELDESQRRQELLATTKLEELSISSASSLSLPQSPSRPQENPEPRLVSGDLPSSPFHDMLDKAFADGKLDESQRSRFLLDFANPEVNKEELFYNIASSFSQPQPTLAIDDSDSTRAKEDKPAPQQKATPNPGPSKEQYAEDQPTPQQTATPNPGPSRAQYAEEDQQTATPNPGATLDDLLDKSFVAHNLQLAQRREDEEPNDLKELLDTTTLEKSSITNASSSSLSQTPLFEVPDTTLLSSSSVSSLVPRGLLIKYFVRLDKWGFFHTYPDRGGPFKSLLEAQEAIDSYHVVQRKIMCMDGLSDEERAVRYALYWYHNGTRKHSIEALNACAYPTKDMVKALLDKHNEDNDLVGDLAYQLEDIVTHKSCFDGKDCIYTSYSHFNITMKTKGADANNLYFAEVMCLCGDYEAYVLTCFCVVQPTDNGECHVCGIDMKHPTNVEYNHGRPKLSRHRCSDQTGDDLFEELFAVRDEAWLKAEEVRVRRMIKEGKEARSKLELENTVDGHGKRNKYVIPAKR